MPMQRVGDLEVHYRERGQGTPLVLIPGNWSTGLWWQSVMERLPGGWRAIAYDVRGRGQTQGPSLPQDLPSLAGDLRGLLDALGLPRAHLMAHSLGTAVAMQLALTHPERVQSLTLIAPVWVDGMPPAYNQPAHQHTLHAQRPYFEASMRAIAPTAPNDAMWKQLLDEGYLQRQDASLATLQAMLEWAPGERLQALRAIPSLVVSGAKDVLCTVDMGHQCAALLGARHQVLVGVGHSPNVEAPERVVELWEDFTRRLPAPGTGAPSK